MTGSGTGPLTPEILVPMLGTYLVEKNLITQAQLEQALQHQAALRSTAGPRPLGYILVELGFISRQALDAATTEQLILLRSALQDANEQLERRVRERTAELDKALEQLSSINELKANLVANISHELRTPLTHLRGYLDLMVAGDFGDMSTEQQNVLGIVQRSAERLNVLIEDLIQFSVSERNQVYLHIRPCDIAELLRSVIKRSQAKADERQINLHLFLPNESMQIAADLDKISWVLMQLVDNAIKFTPVGGEVVLMVEREQNFARLIVQDNGMGIPDDRANDIFEPFYQLDGSSTRKAGGTGLGLALARRIVEAHGSVIHVYSDIGKGSKFEFVLKIMNE
ncbi:MAG: HAMP domain-containing histidine kinase [Anaerolineae bacterium]|nr:HAMP domain-containing histidine kinase [Anaerolineae bacterium]